MLQKLQRSSFLKKIKNGIDVVAIMTPGSHQEIAELFIKNNIHVISDKPFAGSNSS